jgi:hypothetical protein
MTGMFNREKYRPGFGGAQPVNSRITSAIDKVYGPSRQR